MQGGAHLSQLFNERGLQCVMRHVPLPLAWGSENEHCFNEQSSTLMLWPENIWSFEGDVVEGMQIWRYSHTHIPPCHACLACSLTLAHAHTHLRFVSAFCCAHAMHAT